MSITAWGNDGRKEREAEMNERHKDRAKGSEPGEIVDLLLHCLSGCWRFFQCSSEGRFLFRGLLRFGSFGGLF